LSAGSRVNLEADMIGKYVARVVGQVREGKTPGDLLKKLSDWGIG
jgi:riboflavin synthase alpha subunit